MDAPTEALDFSIQMPPNARIRALLFDASGKDLRITLEDDGIERRVPADSVRALYGARIRHESLVRTPLRGRGPALSSIALAASTGLPPNIRIVGDKETVTTTEQLLYALALRLDNIGELWYLLASSFNFRQTLGADATYVADFNLRELVRRLARSCPNAVQDSFFAAIVGGLPLPPPTGSLLEFFRVVSKEV